MNIEYLTKNQNQDEIENILRRILMRYKYPTKNRDQIQISHQESQADINIPPKITIRYEYLTKNPHEVCIICIICNFILRYGASYLHFVTQFCDTKVFCAALWFVKALKLYFYSNESGILGWGDTAQMTSPTVSAANQLKCTL